MNCLHLQCDPPLLSLQGYLLHLQDRLYLLGCHLSYSVLSNEIRQQSVILHCTDLTHLTFVLIDIVRHY